ncbi:NAD(P)H-binding protein [Streptomyces sp. NPDC020917]|uniref:NAD(P)H-binding protein n=1 Tax=Streptomyces sp. NPDC020917 TaxID=3365102 RepID=UPI0037A9BDB6
MTVLITGARGRVARGLTGLLHHAGHDVRAGSRDPGALDLPRGVPAVPLSLARPAQFGPALDGVRSVFLYAEPSHAEEFGAAARAAGVEHVVLLSSSSVTDGPADLKSPLARTHAVAEDALAAAGPDLTVLRPGSFATNALYWARSIAATGTVRLPVPGAHTDPVHEADLAEAAFAVLTRAEARGGVHHLTGPQSLTFTEQLAVVERASGRPIGVEAIGHDAWKAEVAAYMPAEYAAALLEFWLAGDGVPVRLTGTLERLTGRSPRPFAAWAADHAAAFRSAEV